MKLICSIFLILSISSCNRAVVDNSSGSDQHVNKTFLALGDSYTSGEGLSQNKSFPFLLAAKLRTNGVKMENPDVIAETGWTTADLLAALKNVPIDQKYDFVTVLIGVNNQYTKRSLAEYRTHFIEILNTAIRHSKGGRATVYVLSIPDWSVTPFGKINYAKLAPQSVDIYNEVNREESKNANVNNIDITVASRLADKDNSYTAADGLHPSQKMYGNWVEQLYSLVKKELN
ncbi:MAG: SGNH/GDSL hydrolase family protein [Bacteroidota bacterium]